MTFSKVFKQKNRCVLHSYYLCKYLTIELVTFVTSLVIYKQETIAVCLCEKEREQERKNLEYISI